MADYSKRLKREQQIAEAIQKGLEPPTPQTFRCHCGAPAKYEINTALKLAFVCARHLPQDGNW